MKRKTVFLISILFYLIFTIGCSSLNISGTYYFEGNPSSKEYFVFNPDSSFEHHYTSGYLCLMTNYGKYKIQGNTIVVNYEKTNDCNRGMVYAVGPAPDEYQFKENKIIFLGHEYIKS